MKTKTKILVFFIGVSLLVSFSFADAQVAQNTVATPELQAFAQTIRQQIQDIKEKIILLQEQLKQATTGLREVEKTIKFTQNLRKGLRGQEVKNLQEFLSQYPEIYPEGLVTGYFGSLTEKAVKKFQEKYFNDILKPFGFNKGTGFVGGRTIAKLNQLMLRDMPRDMSQERRIIICHYPQGNLDARHTIVINESALEAHLALGDTIGPCEDVPEPEPLEEICFDSDDGLNYYVKGILTYGSFRGDDNCKRAITNSNGEFTGYLPVESCEAGDTCYINEGYCDENANYNGRPLGFVTAVCVNGCEDGACITETVEPEPEPEPEPVDVCPNIDGIQETIPAGLILNNEGNCVASVPDAILGCTDAIATNYNSEATQDDGTCVYPDITPPVISNFQPSGTITDITPLLSLNTDENAICRYSITDQSFDAMPRVFAGAGATFHHVTIETMVAGTYTYYARCRDMAGNKNTNSASITFIVIAETADTTAPVISNIQVSNITQTSATITWRTDEESDSAVNYWKINSYGLVVSDAAAVINHEINLSNLTHGTIYYYKVNSFDDAGNYAQSSNKIFITLFPAPIPEPEPVDVCPNIDGIQEVIPAGLILNNEGNCVAPVPDAILGCTDETAINYNSEATQDDGTCAYPDTTPPTISNIHVSNITQTSATITWRTDEESDSTVNYGLSAFYGFTISKGTDATYHLFNLSNLTADATYHYRVKSIDTAGNQAQSSDKIFTTLTTPESVPDAILGCTDETAINYNSEATQDDGTCAYPDTTPPVISNFQPSGAITDTSPILSLDTNEDAFCKYSIIDQSYDSMPDAFMGAVSTGHHIIFGIMPAGTYTYYARCRDMAGNKNTNSASITFIVIAETADITAPVISNIQVSNITQTSATISWQTNEMADSRVDYGLSTFYGFTVSRGTDAIHHSFNLSNLTAGATHHYRVKSIDTAGNLAQSADRTFPTPAVPDTTPPSNVADFTAVAVDGRIRLSWTNPIVSWTNPTNLDFAGTKILRKTGSYSSGVTDGTQVYNGTASTYTDTDLINGTKYYYKAFTYDEVPNYSSGSEVFATPIHADVPQFLLKWGSAPEGTSFTSAGRLYRPVGIDVDTSGNVYVADTGNHRIQKFTSDGSLISRLGSGLFEWPCDITVDTSGNVYVVDANSRVLKFTSNGALITKWGSKGSGDGQFDSPFGIVVDASGNVYVADIGNQRIQKFTSDGTFITKWGSRGSNDGQFIHPNGITVDASGNVYVADISRSIQKFTSDGTFITKWGSRGSDDGQLKNSRDVAVDASGNVYVMDTGNYRIQKFTSDGLFITKWGFQGSGDGQFDESWGIAVDASGNIYVTDWANHCVQKFVPGQLTILEQKQKLSFIERLLKDIEFQVASLSVVISGLLK